MKKWILWMLVMLLLATPSAPAEEEVLCAPVDLAVEEEQALDLGADAIPGGTEEQAVEAIIYVSSDDNIHIDEEHFPDAAFCAYVKENADFDGDGWLSTNERAAIRALYLTDEPIASLEGYELFPNLQTLNIQRSPMTRLDVSGNTALKKINCTASQIASVNVDGCAALEEFYFNNSRLTGLSISGCPALKHINCDNNQLQRLVIDGSDGLETLACRNNSLTGVDVSRLPRLTVLDVSNNALTRLDVTHNTALETLGCTENRLEKLALAGDKALAVLYCYGNHLTTIDLTGCPKLIALAKQGPEYINIYDGYMFFNPGPDDFTSEIACDYCILAADDEVLYARNPDGSIPTFIHIGKAEVSGVKARVYTGKAIKPVPVVKLDGRTLVRDTDYTVAYKDNKNIGTATVIIRGAGKYTGRLSKTFRINPKKVSSLKLAAGRKKLTVTWKKVKGVSGYELQYGLKKSFAGAKKATVKKAATVKKTLKGLKAKKKYYVRMRAYKTVKGKKYYSSWTKAKSATVRK